MACFPRLDFVVVAITWIKIIQWSTASSEAAPSFECPVHENFATPNPMNVVIGRCISFQTLVQPELFCGTRKKNCTELWEKFSAGFKHQPLCNVPTDGFQDFLSASDHDIAPDKQLFYERTYGLVQRYSNRGKRLISIESTLSGYIVDRLHFCGSSSAADGVAVNTECPSFEVTEQCQQSAEMAFWTATSKHFASKARGRVSVMLNASMAPIFNNDSYFAQFEMPFLNKSLVTSCNILLMNDSPSTNPNPCHEKSVTLMTDILKGRGIPVTCTENPRDVLLQNCADFPALESCQSIQVSTTGSTASSHVTRSWLLSFCILYYFM